MGTKATKQYSISELAKEFGITTRTIRFYEDKGMLKPRREGQRRIFNAADRTRLKLILRGKRIGLSLEESFDIIKLYQQHSGNKAQLEKLLQAITRQKADIEQRKSALLAMEAEINEVENNCRQALNKIM